MSIKLLIIDDDKRQRESLGDVVDSFGYEVHTAGNLSEAKAVIQEKGPIGVVLLDYMFGPNEKTGLDILADLRQMLPQEEVPILLMTGYATLEVAVKALRGGLSDFLIKPIDPTYLKHTLHKNLNEAMLLKENKRLFAEVTAKNEELGLLNDLKSKFLSFCAHDLSNTVSSCTMAADLMTAAIDGLNDAQLKRLHVLLQDSLGQTQRLITDLVDWSSIEKGKFKIERQPVTAEAFMAAPIFTFIPAKAKVKNVNVEIACRVDGGLTFSVDSKRIIQVVTNLLENGLRYTPAGGKLGFSLSQENGALVFSVSDTGEGIHPEDLPHVFESFYQGKDPQKQRGRLGLGLSIAREIVEGHGGKIWVDSEGHGKGAVFSFKIPLHTA